MQRTRKTLLGVFLGGMALNLTPCVYPLIPITGKILYMEAPVAGSVQFNKNIRENSAPILSDPYHEGWLFLVQPDEGIDRAYQSLSSPQDYFDKLRLSEGFKNPEGLSGRA